MVIKVPSYTGWWACFGPQYVENEEIFLPKCVDYQLFIKIGDLEHISTWIDSINTTIMWQRQ